MQFYINCLNSYSFPSLDSLEDDRIAMKEAGLQTLMEEQSKLAAEMEGKAGGGTTTATADGVNKVSSWYI